MYVFHEGPSTIDGSPLVAVATGIRRATKNRKTGPMVQTWILRADVDPLTAIATGKDRAICGDCPLRADPKVSLPRRCYVTVAHAPQRVWKSYRRGSYTKKPLWAIMEEVEYSSLRMGSYGDPGALPKEAWDGAELASTRTGYTHLWRGLQDPWWSRMIMASCEDTRGMIEAARRGWRAFLTLPDGAPAPAGTLECLNSTHGTTCRDCGVCRGTQRATHAPHVFIRPHGTAAAFF